MLFPWCILCAEEKFEKFPLDVLSYENMIQSDPYTINMLKEALYKKGIVGIKNIPEYKDKYRNFIKAAREFSSLPEEVKEAYAPNHSLSGAPLGYEKGKERFKRPDGTWEIDDLKSSYYGFIPDRPNNKWPSEMDLKTPFQQLGCMMSKMGKLVMEKIELVGSKQGIHLDGTSQLGRLLHYCKSKDRLNENPYWCGSHFDHGLFTVLLPACYFIDGKQVEEPSEAGLFVKTIIDASFKKIVADDMEIMLFQVGEFAQLATNDGLRATEHRVHKAFDSIERFTMALFFDAPMDTTIHSYSELTNDTRYGGVKGTPCLYSHWCKESYKRYTEYTIESANLDND